MYYIYRLFYCKKANVANRRVNDSQIFNDAVKILYTVFQRYFTFSYERKRNIEIT